MLPVHHAEMVVSENGKLSLENLPFKSGQAVKVTVVPVGLPSLEEWEPVGPDIDDAEIQRRLQLNQPTYTLAEVLARLEKIP